ncbi:alpha/beta hydrolase [Saccharopolyspora taberi]|uniref:Alpha/beta hydrolase n=1 Tax=Saccharopolyspora taberi TaxID=60895 RepID=A0ABN3V2V3_9PSEU
MTKVTSRDGTTIAYERTGSGPALVLVAPALQNRSAAVVLAELLSERFTVYNYDRRGRGESGDTAPYAVEREIEDLDAVIAEAGGSACVYGSSSGAVLAFRAATAGSRITRLAMFEPPFVGSSSGMVRRYADLIEAGDREGALEHLHRAIGVPEGIVRRLPDSPTWPVMKAMAHTMLYDFAITSDDDGAVPVQRLAAIITPTLVLASEGSSDLLRDAASATAEALPAGTYRCLPGQWHGVPEEALAAELADFFTTS